MTRPKALVSWSGGKDSAWTLHTLRQQGDVEVVGLLTLVDDGSHRVSMHAVSIPLLQKQAEAAGVPLWMVSVPDPCPPEVYAAAMADVLKRASAEGISFVAFGDIFLEEVRSYREERLQGTVLKPLFPLWGRNSLELAREMLAAGVLARITSVDPRLLAPSFVGSTFDTAFIDALPSGVDACGELGEFHTFAFAGPMFKERIPVMPGAVSQNHGFYFADSTLHRAEG
ncbi:adenine nucleotide alpha hydrolase [Corallococcus llansteffanensis]|uniref:Adenine nucleotide alpha hydrolase n=1 Tax=Corallococcus llansteffanensis TaxID=2316731 RepID=A0A3A8NE51_9BACT|nr:adenine nucleotide alpha hydrolase [Corallococcus llansteffanensis]RKH41859.1 adenine nucleotide alpha hydrolase [Corallococcus llansteffanensis]